MFRQSKQESNNTDQLAITVNTAQDNKKIISYLRRKKIVLKELNQLKLNLQHRTQMVKSYESPHHDQSSHHDHHGEQLSST